MVGGSGVEVHVGIELLVGLHELFNSVRVVIPLGIAVGAAEVARHDAQVRGAGILSVIDAVPEAGDFLLLREHPLDELDRVSAFGVDFLEDLENRFIRSTVQRALQSTDRGRDCGMHVGKSCCGNPGGKSRSVQFVVGMQD